MIEEGELEDIRVTMRNISKNTKLAYSLDYTPIHEYFERKNARR